MVRIVVKSFLLFTVSLMFNKVVHSQSELPNGHLKKTNPNELYVSYFQSDNCWGSYEQIVSSELAQSRIKRKNTWDYNELVLFVELSCMTLDDRPSIVSNLNVKFGRYTQPVDWQPNEFRMLKQQLGGNYGGLAISRKTLKGNNFLKTVYARSLNMP